MVGGKTKLSKGRKGRYWPSVVVKSNGLKCYGLFLNTDYLYYVPFSILILNFQLFKCGVSNIHNTRDIFLTLTKLNPNRSKLTNPDIISHP